MPASSKEWGTGSRSSIRLEFTGHVDRLLQHELDLAKLLPRMGTSVAQRGVARVRAGVQADTGARAAPAVRHARRRAWKVARSSVACSLSGSGSCGNTSVSRLPRISSEASALPEVCSGFAGHTQLTVDQHECAREARKRRFQNRWAPSWPHDDHALACGEAAGLHHDGRALRGQPRRIEIRARELAVARSRECRGGRGIPW